jgi:hypothetical protein
MVTPGVDPSEMLYRQVGQGGNPIYYDPDRRPPLHSGLFIPAKKDTDGLSLIRSRFRSKVWSAYRVEKLKRKYATLPVISGRGFSCAFPEVLTTFDYRMVQNDAVRSSVRFSVPLCLPCFVGFGIALDALLKTPCGFNSRFFRAVVARRREAAFRCDDRYRPRR